MRLSHLLLISITALFYSNVHATETLSEKGEAISNEIKRDASKAINRVDEAACTGTAAECAKKKIDHRAEEAKDTIKDKSSEIKNKID